MAAVGGLPRMQAMPRFPITTTAHRAIWGALLLWCCVLAATAAAPWLHAQQLASSVERLCSGHDGAVQWVLSPAAADVQEDAQALHHLLDCPLCVPVLATPPPASVMAVAELAQHHASPYFWVTALRRSAHWPPPRGPPFLI